MALVVSLSLVMMIIALLALYLYELFGAAEELQSRTDSGALSVAVQELRNGVALNPGSELTNFYPWLDSNQTIDLYSCNGPVGQTMLVAINAQQEGTAQAGADAMSLQSDLSDIESRLLAAQKQHLQFANTAFNTGRSDPLQLLGLGGGSTLPVTAIAALKINDNQSVAANVYWPDTLPKIPSGSSKGTAFFPDTTTPGNSLLGNQPYLTGYNTFTIQVPGGSVGPIVPAGNRPILQPRLVATTLDAIPDDGVTPANAFVVSTQGKDVEVPQSNKPSKSKQIDSQTLANNSIGLVGVPNNPGACDVPASIPGGFVQIFNNFGWGSPQSMPNPNSLLFNNQLSTQPGSGIYIATDANNNPIAFAAGDAGLQALNQWVQSNANVSSGSPDPATAQIFNASDGSQATPAQLKLATQIHSAPGPLGDARNPRPCTNANSAGGSGDDPACSCHMQAFENAYPSSNSLMPYNNGGASQLIALEQFDASLFQGYQLAWGAWNVFCQHGYTVAQANVSLVMPDICTNPPNIQSRQNSQNSFTLGTPPAPAGQQGPFFGSGVRIFDHHPQPSGPLPPEQFCAATNVPAVMYSSPYTAPSGGPYLFSHPGTFSQLITQVTGGSVTDFLTSTSPGQQLMGRAYEINPATTIAAVAAALNASNQQVDLGSSLFLYMDNPTNRKWVVSTSPPPWVKGNPGNPDGTEPAFNPKTGQFSQGSSGYVGKPYPVDSALCGDNNHQCGMHNLPFYQSPFYDANGNQIHPITEYEVMGFWPGSGYNGHSPHLGTLNFGEYLNYQNITISQPN
jgi:hypothetical protein